MTVAYVRIGSDLHACYERNKDKLLFPFPPRQEGEHLEFRTEDYHLLRRVAGEEPSPLLPTREDATFRIDPGWSLGAVLIEPMAVVPMASPLGKFYQAAEDKFPFNPLIAGQNFFFPRPDFMQLVLAAEPSPPQREALRIAGLITGRCNPYRKDEMPDVDVLGDFIAQLDPWNLRRWWQGDKNVHSPSITQ